MGGGNGQKAKMAREKNLEKSKAPKGSQLESNKKAMKYSVQGHKIMVASVAGRENRSMTLGLSFLEDHKLWDLSDKDSFYEASEEEIKALKEALQEVNSLDTSEESKLSLENVKIRFQRNFSENHLAW
ncbi:hypothetical protein Sango_2686900 [Sesamum angolense]|uniref:Small EDRK-rich factor-like N-terminal domain-containing protein n=1 Tax=Sesamum angolense TaxID=2727404 RepID=A0AAE1W2W1_9LAMI|nr:hypothetical protein Sango_2686900 [Sesamum angolense]